ncbi:MAG: hypothetical protein KA715_04915 [Xanthomonadaceae bacterium]|nr:hypothetical protein [Xanthomonadaceae bacterium]
MISKKSPTPKKWNLTIAKNLISIKTNDTPDMQYVFLRMMMELSYTWHFDLVMKIADESWPNEKPGLVEFKNEFSEALKKSPYWKKF